MRSFDPAVWPWFMHNSRRIACAEGMNLKQMLYIHQDEMSIDVNMYKKQVYEF